MAINLPDFTEEVRDFLNEKLTPELRHFGDTFPSYDLPLSVAKEWTAILAEKGWSVPEWPTEYGGTGWTIEQIVTFKRELTLARAPRLQVQGVSYVGPVVIEYGTDEQKDQILPRIRSGEDWWAQGYSEPGAGSDLVALKCRAEKDGDDYIINGTKIWTTYAHKANKIFCLVRTRDLAKPQAGITFLMFDLDLPGIEVRPIMTFGGEHEFNQVFFTDVRVPGSALLGEEDNGWTVAKFLLIGERAHSFAADVHVCLQRTRDFAKQIGLTDDPVYRTKLASLEIELASLDASEQKIFNLLKKDITAASALSSVTKVQGTSLRQRATELSIEILDHYQLPQQPTLMAPAEIDEVVGRPTAHTAVAARQYFFDRAVTIASGTTEVQKNVVAKQVLGL